jgi:DNA-binding MarR family transcriptional regulator
MEEIKKQEMFEKCLIDDEYYYEVMSNPLLSPTYSEMLNFESFKTGITAEECERRLLRKKVDLFKEITKEFQKEIVGEEDSIRALIVICMSRLVKNKKTTSFHTIINSESGSGKDFILNKFENLFSEVTTKYSRVSAKALDYKGSSEQEIEEGFTWDGKILILSDVNNEILNNDTLKTFLSDGSQTAIVTDGKLIERHIRGIPVVLMSSYKCDPEHELLRRLNILNLDESEEQTKRIMQFDYDERTDYKKLKWMVRKFKEHNVIIPFKNELVNLMSSNIYMRTYFSKILDFVKSVAIINQFNRGMKKNDIVAEIEDYEIAKEILEKMSYGTNFRPLALSEKARLKRLREYFGSNYFTLTEAANEFGTAKSTLSEQLTRLEYDNYLERVNFKDEYDSCRIKYHLLDDKKPSLPLLSRKS